MTERQGDEGCSNFEEPVGEAVKTDCSRLDFVYGLEDAAFSKMGVWYNCIYRGLRWREGIVGSVDMAAKCWLSCSTVTGMVRLRVLAFLLPALLAPTIVCYSFC